ncbi:conserved protein of unknown function [Paraburkholderia kururiensis]
MVAGELCISALARARHEANRDARGLAMCDAMEISPHSAAVQTDVAVYLGDCSGDTLLVVCDGTSIESGGTTSQRALRALAHPTPRGPYAVSERFTIFVHETSCSAAAGTRLVATFRIDLRCEGAWAYATVRSAESSSDLPPIPYMTGDDVVTTGRRLLEAWPVGLQTDDDRQC